MRTHVTGHYQGSRLINAQQTPRARPCPLSPLAPRPAPFLCAADTVFINSLTRVYCLAEDPNAVPPATKEEHDAAISERQARKGA